MNNYEKSIGALNAFYLPILFGLAFILSPYILGMISSAFGVAIIFILLLLPVIFGTISSLMLYSRKREQFRNLSITEKIFFYAPFINELVMILIFCWFFI